MYQQSLRRWEGGRAVALAELPRSSSTPLRSVTGLQSAVQGIHATRGRARQLWRIFQTSRIPMTVADSRRRHLAANAPARLFFRLTLADVLERRIDDLTPPDKMHLLYDRWARLMGSGKVAGPYDLCLPDGSEPSIVYSAVANALPGQHVIVFAPADWPEGELVDLHDEAIQASPRALTAREHEVLRLIAAGADRQEIAHELTISVATVRTHVRNILRKLNARNRAHAISLAMQHGLLDARGDVD